MVDILHRIAVKDIGPAQVYDALATSDGVASWWLGDTTGDERVGGTLRFGAAATAEITELQPGRRVAWHIVEGPNEWVGTDVTFDLRREDDHTVVLFTHAGWSEPVEFMHHCSTKWGVFMLSLKQLLESGTGRPTPDDIHIDNWS